MILISRWGKESFDRVWDVDNLYAKRIHSNCFREICEWKSISEPISGCQAQRMVYIHRYQMDIIKVRNELKCKKSQLIDIFVELSKK